MKNLVTITLAATLACFSFGAAAGPLLNPSPADLLDDIDGSGYFSAADSILAIEILDLFESFSLPGSSFGFYFQGADVNDSSNLVTIFSSADSVLDQASINFTTGTVFDIEDGAVESTFTGSGNIGFFLSITAEGGGNIFSDSSLNSDVDWFGAFPFIGAPNLLALSFQLEDPANILSLHIGTDLVPVPEPSSFLLMLLGLIGLARYHRTVSTATNVNFSV